MSVHVKSAGGSGTLYNLHTCHPQLKPRLEWMVRKSNSCSQNSSCTSNSQTREKIETGGIHPKATKFSGFNFAPYAIYFEALERFSSAWPSTNHMQMLTSSLKQMVYSCKATMPCTEKRITHVHLLLGNLFHHLHCRWTNSAQKLEYLHFVLLVTPPSNENLETHKL